MSAYNVCVREIIKKPRIFSRKVKLRGQVWSFEDNFSGKNKISRQTSEPERCLFILWPPPPPPHFIIAENCSFPDWNSRVGFFPMPMPIIAPVTLVHLQLFQFSKLKIRLIWLSAKTWLGWRVKNCVVQVWYLSVIMLAVRFFYLLTLLVE